MKEQPRLPEKRPNLVLVDGNSLLYRAFFALPMLTTSQGEVTNAIYGFTVMLYKVLEGVRPDCIAVCFDLPKPTFRHHRYAEYKATRERAPDELRAQMDPAKDILQAMRIPILEREGYEADDVIGAMATQAAGAGYDVLIVTGDLDTLQLVSPRVSVMTTKRGITDTVIYDEAAVRERYGVTPEQLPDLKALRGDTSDNIPGVPGVGDKTSSKLVQEFGSVEELVSHLDRVESPKLADALRTYAEQLAMSKDLATIRTDVGVQFDLEQCRLGPPDEDKLAELFRRFEFKSLLGKLEVSEEAELRPTVLSSAKQVADMAQRLLKAERMAVILAYRSADPFDRLRVAPTPSTGSGSPRAGSRGDGLRSEVVGAAFFAHGVGPYFVPLADDGGAPREELWQVLAAVWADERAPKATHDLKRAYNALRRRGRCAACGRSLGGGGFDTMLASYLLNPARQTHRIADIAFDQLQISPGEETDVAKAWAEGDIEAVAHQACVWAHQTYQLEPVLRRRLEESYLAELYDTVELPLTAVLSDMELVGVKIDVAHLRRLSVLLAQRIHDLERQVHELAGEEFTINSPKQLRAILFDKLGLPPSKRTKTGYSTGAQVLEALAERHEIARRILQYREVAKLQSTYVEALPKLLDPATGRVHTSLNQTVTATGRLSSSDPNLQNIPVRGDLGQNIRRAFIAGEPGWVLLAADYSQIELRVLAHISRDEGLLAIFHAGEDLHTRTACEIFSVPPQQVNHDMRRLAKVVNFGIPYGMTEHGLARDMGVSQAEARDYIERYFRRFPGVRDYMDSIVEEARRTGYVTTILGRRRALPDLGSRARNLREFAERTAINTPIQGSAADIIKLAMLAVHRELGKAGHRARMTLQVHDELLLELPQEELGVVAPLVCRCMSQAYPLVVPLTVEMKAGPNWADMEAVSG
jgi:DNA polymerase-1